MSQSLVRNYIHIVFSTKYREPTILPFIEGELYNYLGGICKSLECNPVIVGGYTNHVHVLCILSKKISIVTLMEKLKSHSSKWIKTKSEVFHNFYWQDGYGAFSVSPSEVQVVKNYIQNQGVHHRAKNFQDEFRAFLKENDVDYDERYVWD